MNPGRTQCPDACLGPQHPADKQPYPQYGLSLGVARTVWSQALRTKPQALPYCPTWRLPAMARSSLSSRVPAPLTGPWGHGRRRGHPALSASDDGGDLPNELVLQRPLASAA